MAMDQDTLEVLGAYGDLASDLGMERDFNLATMPFTEMDWADQMRLSPELMRAQRAGDISITDARRQGAMPKAYRAAQDVLMGDIMGQINRAPYNPELKQSIWEGQTYIDDYVSAANDFASTLTGKPTKAQERQLINEFYQSIGDTGALMGAGVANLGMGLMGGGAAGINELGRMAAGESPDWSQVPRYFDEYSQTFGMPEVSPRSAQGLAEIAQWAESNAPYIDTYRNSLREMNPDSTAADVIDYATWIDELALPMAAAQGVGSSLYYGDPIDKLMYAFGSDQPFVGLDDYLANIPQVDDSLSLFDEPETMPVPMAYRGM